MIFTPPTTIKINATTNNKSHVHLNAKITAPLTINIPPTQ
jgi:hypothetical protein